MKKTLLALILLWGIGFGAFSQPAGPVDLVVVLDTSVAMSNYYWETSDYLVGPFLREFLRVGDTFHLISFAETPRLELSRRVESAGDLEIIIARLLLMYPLGRQANIGSALSFAEGHIAALPVARPRMVVLISDGTAPGTEGMISAASARLQAVGAQLQFIRTPVIGAGPPSGRPAVALPPAVAAQPPAVVVQPPAVVAPPPPGVQPPAIVAPPPGVQPPAVVTPPPPGVQPPAVVTPPPGIQPPGVVAPPPPGVGAPPPDVAVQPGVVPPPGLQPPAVVAPPPGVQPPAVVAQGGFFAEGIPPALLIALAILALGLLGFLIFFAARRLQGSPNRTVAQTARMSQEQAASAAADAAFMNKYAAAQKGNTGMPASMPRTIPETSPRTMLGGAIPHQNPTQTQKPMPKDKVYAPVQEDAGPMMLNLFVEDQNTAIGRRNIHTAKSGQTFSVGGGNSDFLIFLVPVPPNIAEVRCHGRNCTFIPKKPQYFPDIGSQSVQDCIGKNIRVISDRNYELHIRIERYEDPLKALNKLLNSISVPGEVK